MRTSVWSPANAPGSSVVKSARRVACAGGVISIETLRLCPPGSQLSEKATTTTVPSLATPSRYHHS